MNFLKTLAREAELMSEHGSGTNLHTSMPEIAAETYELSTPLVALHAAVVMEIMCDELEVLAASVNVPRPELRTAESIYFDRQTRPRITLKEVPLGLKNRRKSRNSTAFRPSIEQRYSTVIPRRMLQGLGGVSLWPNDAAKCLMSNAKIKTDTPAGKYQLDLTYLQLVADNCLRELMHTCSFNSLPAIVQHEKTVLKKFWLTCIKLTQDRVNIAKLKERIQNVKVEKHEAVTELDAEVFRLTDSGLELDRRLGLETRLMEKQVIMLVRRFKRRHRNVINYHHDEIKQWKIKFRLETRVHWEIEKYLQKVIRERDAELNYWMDKYEGDYSRLCFAFDEMVQARDRDLKRARWLEVMIKRREPIVAEDKRLKALFAEAVRQRQRRQWGAIKVQSWWRGTMVRNQLGPYMPVIVQPKKKGAKK